MHHTMKFYIERDAHGNLVTARFTTAREVLEWFRFERTDRSLESYHPHWSLKETHSATEEHDAEFDYLPDGESAPRAMTDAEVFEAYCAYIFYTTTHTASVKE